MKVKGKKGLITKTWERCKSLGHHDRRHRHHHVTPEGCFSVYVGPEKQRFVVKTEHANHPLFILHLKEAESEFGYHSEGPLVLPCDVAVFYKVLLEMQDCDGDGSEDGNKIPTGCGFKRYRSYHLLGPSRMVAINQF